MNSLLTDPTNHPANGPLTVERITHLIAELRRSLDYQNGGDMAYVIADAIKGLEELLEIRKSEGGWIPMSERMPDPQNEFRVCVFTPTPHEDLRYRFVSASLFKSVCRDATHWHYMMPPKAL